MAQSLFSDLLVIDCASFIAGPAAATIMSDFGARVIKIEPPGLGDSYRSLARMRGPDVPDWFWTMDSRNKESLAIDLKLLEARAVLEKLVRRADVFLTNFPFPVRERLRLRAEDLMPLNERLIYASLSPYGEAGPERNRTAYDTTAWWARSGFMEMVKPYADAEASFSLPGMGDHPTAMATYAAIATALYRRALTGKGGAVATSLMANGLWANSCQVQAALCDIELTGRQRGGMRSALGEIYHTSDERSFILAVVNPAREYALLTRAVGREDLLDDERFSTPMARMQNAAELIAILQDIFGREPWAHWHAKLSEAGVTFGIVGRVTDHIADPQVEANGFLPEFEDGFGLKTVDSPFYVDGVEKTQPRMAPEVGQHTLKILEECGCTDAEIRALMPAE
ncbi:MAG TPA: CoA transferase [Caulobacteraceae bacterium]|nr:CoA transferase [Caulobacteraceae bacterium]